MREPTKLGIFLVVVMAVFCAVAIAIIDRRAEGGLWAVEWWQWLRQAWT